MMKILRLMETAHKRINIAFLFVFFSILLLFDEFSIYSGINPNVTQSLEIFFEKKEIKHVISLHLSSCHKNVVFQMLK